MFRPAIGLLLSLSGLPVMAMTVDEKSVTFAGGAVAGIFWHSPANDNSHFRHSAQKAAMLSERLGDTDLGEHDFIYPDAMLFEAPKFAHFPSLEHPSASLDDDMPKLDTNGITQAQPAVSADNNNQTASRLTAGSRKPSFLDTLRIQ